MEPPAEISPFRPVTGPARWLLLALAFVCLALGFIGILVPVLPTVPFLLVAAWAAARSSPRIHQYLETHPKFGSMLRDWREAGIVPRRAKWAATVMMSASSVLLLVAVRPLWAALLAVASMAGVAAWLWRRPERR